ncbi:uncharacterized protein IUM83_11834 [Phytophthora cinnamomi]|uniref:uncharacterized protein n=1 Tax=Phytophthora cinnamomi TaxID=4785 RepID=UPI00355A25AF|nr:hypothetical protein IUM83_11834 [Phytophthora cinnamomi]
MGSFPPSPACTQIATKSMGRGRQPGHQNYSDKEELSLCDVAAKFLPTGRNMWEAVAADYYASKEWKWATRDFDSLRRKFRNLYGKPKPTGNQGNQLSRRQRAVLLVHEVQFAFEKKGGALTSHDGLDNGEDDAILLREVAAATNGNGKNPPLSAKGKDEVSSEDDDDEDGNDAASVSTHLDEEDKRSDENTTDVNIPCGPSIQRFSIFAKADLAYEGPW